MELARTPRFVLRAWAEDDLEAFFDIYSRDAVTRWLGPHPRRAVRDRAEATQRLARWQVRVEALTPPLGIWAVVPTGSAPVGTVILLPLEEPDGTVGDQVEVGWHLHPDHQGRGLATEAARTLLALGAEAGYDDVLALTDPDNLASQAVTQRLGMVDEGLTDRWFGLTTRQFRHRAHRPA